MTVRKTTVPLDEELVPRTRLEDVRGACMSSLRHRRMSALGASPRSPASAPSASVIGMDRDIERAAHTLAEAAGSPVRVILFGSHARGDARLGSDLDFLVIEPEVQDRHAEMVRLRRALHGMRRPIDVLVVSEAQVEEWGEARGTVLQAALSEGRVLVEA